MLQYPPRSESRLAHALVEHAAFVHPIPSRHDLLRLAWSVAHLPDASALNLALAESVVLLANEVARQEEVIRRLQAATLAQRELGT